MKILVTGCAGFIGSHLCEKLLSLNPSLFKEIATTPQPEPKSRIFLFTMSLQLLITESTSNLVVPVGLKTPSNKYKSIAVFVKLNLIFSMFFIKSRGKKISILYVIITK